MNEPTERPQFTHDLLKQEPAIAEAGFDERRQALLIRLERARMRERRARRILSGLLVFGVAVTGSLMAYATGAVGRSGEWPEWMKYLAAMVMLLTPVAMVMILGLYLLRHRRELKQARELADQMALAGLQRQIDELRIQVGCARESRPATADLTGSTAELPPPVPPQPGQSVQSGFTLVEILAVVAVIGILAALLGPAAASVRRRAVTAQCEGNLSQLGRALAIYVQESRRYPGTRGSPVAPGSPILTVKVNTNISWILWDRRLAPYYASRTALLKCPGHAPSVFPGNAFTNYSYGYNAYGAGIVWAGQNLGLGRVQPPDDFTTDSPMMETTEESVRVPSDMIAIADLEDIGSSFCSCVVVPTQWPSAPGAWHRSGANAVFCDGHVEWQAKSAWTNAAPDARRRWNNDHQPHPELW